MTNEKCEMKRTRCVVRHRTPLLLLVAALLAVPALSADEKPILVVYDLTSDFDGGRMGKWVADMLRGHARRSKMYLTVDAITFADLMADAAFKVTGQADPQALADFTRRTFAGDIFIFGEVSQKPPEGYVLVFRAYRIVANKPEKLLEESYDCPGKQFCSGAVDAALKKLADIGDPTEEWAKLADGLKSFSMTWRKTLEGTAPTDELSKAMTDWAGKLLTTERKLTSYRMGEEGGAHQEILDQFRKLVGDVGTASGALKENPAEGRTRTRQVLADAERIAGNIRAWLDAGTVEGRWKTGKNLVRNGAFTHGQLAPVHWDLLKQGVTWVKSPDPRDAADKCIRMDVSARIDRKSVV